jgi:tetratricopeptide (TPR) repeat protein
MLLTTCYLLLFVAIDLNPPDLQSLIHAGLGFSYVENFDSARCYFDSATALYPDNPAGYFFNAALLQLEMMDGCNFDHENEFFDLMKKVTVISQSIMKTDPDPWAQFYLGSAYAYRAVHEGLKKNYLETFSYGVKGGRMLQEVVKEDSSFYEAYLGCATFEYFWARAARYLPILKLAGGNAEEAIRKMHVAAQKSLYSGPTAWNSLVFIYGEEGKYDEAMEIAESLLVQYPKSKTFLWNKAELEYKRKRYAAARELYALLFERYDESASDKNYSNLAQCKLFTGKCSFELKERGAARTALKEVLQYKQYSERYPKIKEYCREAYSLLSKLL